MSNHSATRKVTMTVEIDVLVPQSTDVDALTIDLESAVVHDEGGPLAGAIIEGWCTVDCDAVPATPPPPVTPASRPPSRSTHR